MPGETLRALLQYQRHSLVRKVTEPSRRVNSSRSSCREKSCRPPTDRVPDLRTARSEQYVVAGVAGLGDLAGERNACRSGPVLARLGEQESQRWTSSFR